MVMGALIRRELLRECRHRLHFLGRATFVIVLALLVSWHWISMSFFDLRTAQAELARYGAGIFSIWVLVQYLALVAFTTVRSGALADERGKGSLPLARITCLGDRGVVVGWFVSVMGRAVFTMALALPVLVLARSFGGFTMGQVVAATVVTIAAAAHSGALTLALAALSPSTGTAVAVSIVLQLLWTMRIFLSRGQIGELTLSSGLILNRIISLSGPAVMNLAEPVISYVVVVSLLVLAYLALAVRSLDLPVPRPGRRIKALLVTADRCFMRLAQRGHVFWQPGMGPCRGNPVLWRERAVSPFGQRDHVIRLFYWPLALMIVLAVLVYPLSGYRGVLFVVQSGLILIPLLVFGVLLVVGPAATFARERQQGTLALLSVTPLSARKIVMGKYLFGLRLLWVPLALVTVFCVCVSYVYGLGALSRMVPLLLMVALMLLVSAQLLYVGAGAKSTASAIIAGVAFLGGVLLLLFAWATFPLGFIQVLSRYALRPAPPLALQAAIALALTGVALVPRAWWARNVVMVALWVCAPLLVATFLTEALGRTPYWGGFLWLLGFPLPVLALTLGVLALRRGRSGLGLASGLLLAGALMLMVVLAPASGWLVLYGSLVVVLWRAVVHAGPELVNRTALALLVSWPLYGFLSANLSRSFYGPSWYRPSYSYGPAWYGPSFWQWLSAPSQWAVLLGATAVVAVLFLRVTIRELDRLMGRYG